MLKKLQKSNNKGFTIIEVMIVLAIAALILLIVLLAVPALQRSSRNTQRKNDVSALSGAIANVISDNNGVPPTGIAAGTTATSVLACGAMGGATGAASATGCTPSESATLGYYARADVFLVQAGTAYTPTLGTSNPTPTKVTPDSVTIVLGATCNGTAVVTGTGRTAALVYVDESGGGSNNIQCTEQ
jgi:type IV pilus assembly protein PilA